MTTAAALHAYLGKTDDFNKKISDAFAGLTDLLEERKKLIEEGAKVLRNKSAAAGMLAKAKMTVQIPTGDGKVLELKAGRDEAPEDVKEPDENGGD